MLCSSSPEVNLVRGSAQSSRESRMEDLSANVLVNRLSEIFPGFSAEWLADTEGSTFPVLSRHSVYQSFLPFVSGLAATDKQWSALASLLNEEVSAGGDRENAAATCFLEHCGQVGLARKLRPFLDEARRSLHDRQQRL